MSSCPDTSTLVSLSTAVEWNTHELLSHLPTCPDCGERLRRLAVVRQVLVETEEPARGFTESVAARATGEERVRGTRRWSTVLIGLLNPTLAGATALFVVGLATETGLIEFGSGALVFALAIGVATFSWNQVTSSRQAR